MSHWIHRIRGVENELIYQNKPHVSQNGEEHYLDFIFQNIGVKYKFLVDIGANDGMFLSNTKLFREKGWESILIDREDFPGIGQEFVTVETVLEILDRYKCPIEFDLLSLDIDGNDYWVLEKILSKYKPRVIISEYNSEHDPLESKAIEYDPFFVFKCDDYYGYTFSAGLKLAERFGYKVVYQNGDLNMYYLRKDELPNFRFTVNAVKKAWWGVHSEKKWVQV